MKTQALVWLVALTLARSLSLAADDASPHLTNDVTSPVRPLPLASRDLIVENVPPSEVLSLYARVSGLELITSSRVTNLVTSITLLPAWGDDSPELLKIIETALLQQAGVVLTKLDEKRVSVTYNDALPHRHVFYEEPPKMPTNLMTYAEAMRFLRNYAATNRMEYTIPNKGRKVPDATPASTNK